MYYVDLIWEVAKDGIFGGYKETCAVDFELFFEYLDWKRGQ